MALELGASVRPIGAHPCAAPSLCEIASVVCLVSDNRRHMLKSPARTRAPTGFGPVAQAYVLSPERGWMHRRLAMAGYAERPSGIRRCILTTRQPLTANLLHRHHKVRRMPCFRLNIFGRNSFHIPVWQLRDCGEIASILLVHAAKSDMSSMPSQVCVSPATSVASDSSQTASAERMITANAAVSAALIRKG